MSIRSKLETERATQVPFGPTADIAATDAERAILAVQANLATDAAALAAHLADTSDAHDASAISVANAGALYAATDVEAALTEVMTAVNTHVADGSAAHAAAAISFSATGDISSTDVQAAIAELDSEKLNTADLLTAILAIDGAGSGIDADLLDGMSSAAFQPVDSDLTAIAGLSPSNDDVIQRKAGAWTNRTMAQLIADLAALGTTFQPLDSDLTAIAALITDAAGRSILTLADPNADRIAFWDDSAGSYAHLALSGLTITTTTLAVDAASTSAAGVSELATAAETTTGTDAARTITPDGLAGSDYGKRVVSILVFDDSQNVATGDGAGDVFWRVPAVLNGWNLVAVAAQVQTAGTTNTTDIQIANVTQAADMLTTKITIDSGETDSSTAATAAVIDTSNDDVATGDRLRIDVDAVSTTPPKGLLVELTFQLP